MVSMKLVVLVAATAVSAASFGAIDMRSIASNGGRSLQADSAPAGAADCGGGSYCPSGLSCNTKAQSEVAACCPSGKDFLQ